MDENIQFSWGKKKARGGAKMDTQFYDSFTFDNVKYSLYDCVYLFKKGDSEPYIGKIVKIWQQNQVKKVKILWFFSPDEIRNYLKGPVVEKEIFLASGDGTGLADINPLEAIAGKCTVVCISKDDRNRQPTPREQAVADYIFYRFFDVGSCTLSDQVPEKIAGQEVSNLLNPKDEQVTCCPDQEVQGVDHKAGAGLKPVSLHQSPVRNRMEDESPVAGVPLPQLTVQEEDKNQVAVVPLPPAAKEEEKSQVDAIILPPAVEEDAPKPTQNIPKRTQKVLPEKMPSKKLKFSQDLAVQNVAPIIPDATVCPGPLELTTRQAVPDRSKWFKPIPWEEQLQMGDEEGRLVYIQNLDIQFGSSDVMELIREALQLTCNAKTINHPTYDDPNNGKAYAVFKSKNAADTAVTKINSGLIVNGRPLYCSKGLLKVPTPPASGALMGHLTISNKKMGRAQRDEQKKAVSTSHCSQPNTIEYDLALDWMLVREKQARKFSILHKKHAEERKLFTAKMGK
ncbi:protein ANTI-SILENCING 1 [Brachypodium distachyon]|uniref:BAH domain-containing protein n=1 Tax=Brachypodium distachyon TaxID=15368 RepID=I1GSD4_BRADI|nr:protein ANTI-SILENCING 1 [Brachypodium distachyon]KQK15256.1 hypothetical protein BRADI_1g21470v3 [Brachypodium distachyon]|eukprot:XP_003559962.1 protein ANTI-SILENCING 1 [Brachypodium distachyon]